MAARPPVTVLTRITEECIDAMHLWCPGTVGRRRPQACLCPCHRLGRTTERAS